MWVVRNLSYRGGKPFYALKMLSGGRVLSTDRLSDAKKFNTEQDAEDFICRAMNGNNLVVEKIL